jgi:F-type H+-transporting ATPase subunit gamma
MHPLLQRREEKNVMLVVITSDRGLAGAFNSGITKATDRRWRELEAAGVKVCFAVIGRKGRDHLRRRDADIRHEFTGVFENLSVERAGEIARFIIDEYTSKNLDACYLVYNEFKSAIAQDVRVESLLPIVPTETSEKAARAVATSSTNPASPSCWTGCCPCTWRSRSSVACSSPWPPSTARA